MAGLGHPILVKGGAVSWEMTEATLKRRRLTTIMTMAVRIVRPDED